MQSTLALCALFALPGLTRGQQFLIVDDDPGADFQEIQAAIDAVEEGGVVFVRAGLYSPFDIDGKGLSVLGEGQDLVRVQLESSGAGCRIAGLGANQSVTLAGFGVRNNFEEISDDFLTVESTAGLVWLQDLELSFDALFFPVFGFESSQLHAVKLEDAKRVVMAGCRIVGVQGSVLGPGPELGAQGLVVVNSTVDLYDTTVIGGPPTFGGGTGREGMTLENSVATIHGGFIQGSSGGPEDASVGAEAGQGGTGLFVDATSTARDLGATLQGGPGGGVFGSGFFGISLKQEIGATIFSFEAPTATLTAPTLTGDDEAFTVTLQGEPSAVAVLFASLTPDPVYLPGLPGTSALGLAPVVFSAVTLDAMGEVEFMFGVPPLPAGLESFTAGLAAATVDPLGRVSMTNPILVTLVEQSVL